MTRALVLSTGKELFERSRAPLRGRVEFLDLTAGVDIPGFTPEAHTLAAVDGHMARTPFQYVVATSESNMLFAGLLRSRYGLSGMSYNQTLVATNKWRMKQAVRGAYPTAAGWLSGDFLELRGARPDVVVLKPLSSSAARGVRLMPLPQAVAELRASSELLLVEEALDVTSELHCDGVVRDGTLCWVVVSAYDRPVLVSAGTRASVHLPPADPRSSAAEAATRRVVGALPVTDFVFHLELMEVAGDLVFGEIGLRPAGAGVAESVARSFGVDLWQQFTCLPVGLPEPPGRPARGHDLLSGVIAGRPSERGGPLPARAAAGLPGVIGTSPGNIPEGEPAPDSCSYYYLAFFDGLQDNEFAELMEWISWPQPLPHQCAPGRRPT